MQGRPPPVPRPGTSLGEGLGETFAPEACGKPCFLASGSQANGTPGPQGSTSSCPRKSVSLALGCRAECERENPTGLAVGPPLTQEDRGLSSQLHQTAGTHRPTPRSSDITWFVPSPAWSPASPPPEMPQTLFHPHEPELASEAGNPRTAPGVMVSLNFPHRQRGSNSFQ